MKPRPSIPGGPPANWSDRLLFERLALSRDREGVLALARKGHEIQQPSDLIKDPYVLEFTGIPQHERFLESDLEQAFIDKLREFLLELGKGFAFMARQQRITIDGQHYWIDLVFYNRLTRSFVLIDLKVGTLCAGPLPMTWIPMPTMKRRSYFPVGTSSASPTARRQAVRRFAGLPGPSQATRTRTAESPSRWVTWPDCFVTSRICLRNKGEGQRKESFIHAAAIPPIAIKFKLV
jgi:predicted nuclease of restriction endonuclease-like (RecB) superfamily